jgi:RNA polymerase sigma-70 factor (ECF subfamily)
MGANRDPADPWRPIRPPASFLYVGNDEGGRGSRSDRILRLLSLERPLTEEEVEELRELFPDLIVAHHGRVWERFRRCKLQKADAEDLLQQTFLALFDWVCRHGPPKNLPGLLGELAEGRFLNHLHRERRRARESVALPSSGSEKPASEPDVERALDLRELVRSALPRLCPEHREVIDAVVIRGLTHTDAAGLLGIPEGTLKTRLAAAKRELHEIASVLFPPSQRVAG